MLDIYSYDDLTTARLYCALRLCAVAGVVKCCVSMFMDITLVYLYVCDTCVTKLARVYTQPHGHKVVWSQDKSFYLRVRAQRSLEVHALSVRIFTCSTPFLGIILKHQHTHNTHTHEGTRNIIAHWVWVCIILYVLNGSLHLSFLFPRLACCSVCCV